MSSIDYGVPGSPAGSAPSMPGWVVVAERELRDLWLGGRAPALVLGFSLLFSALTYLLATNQELNLLAQKDTVNLVMQITMAAGVVLALIVSADAFSGERERNTLEILLLTPVPRRQIAIGKSVAAVSLWAAALLVAMPYVWVLTEGPGIFVDAVFSGFVVGVLLAIAFTSLGIIISTLSGTNRVSLSLSLFIFVALLAPTQLPGGALKGWLGDLLTRINPMTAGAHYMDKILVSNYSWTQDAAWLISPALAALLAAAAALLITGRIRLHGGVLE